MSRWWFLVFLAFISTIDSRAQGTWNGYWSRRAPLPTPRQEVSQALLNGRIYVVAGLDASVNGTTTVEVYDPVTNTWSSAAPLPERLHHTAMAELGGKLYVLGGYTGSSFSPSFRVYEYSPDSNAWRSRAFMPVARGAHIAIPFGEKIFLFGGVEPGGVISRRTDTYDPVSNSWGTVASMPTAREHLAGAVIDSLIYLVGGRTNSGNRNELEAYSPSSNRWYAKPDMPTARSGHAAATLHGLLYVMGGEIPGVFSENEEYDPVTETWRAVAPMRTARHGINAVTYEDTIVVIGGATIAGFAVTAVNEGFIAGAPSSTISGSVVDSATGEMVTNGFVFFPESGDSIHLSRTDGAYQIGYLPGDPWSTVTANVRSFPFVPSSTTFSFVPDSAIETDLRLQRIPAATISGFVVDTAKSEPVHALITLSASTIMGPQVWRASSDSTGWFSFDSLYGTHPPIVSAYTMLVEPEFPFARRVFPPWAIKPGDSHIDVEVVSADIFLVGEDSANYRSYYQTALDSIGISWHAWNSVERGVAPFERGVELRRKTIVYFSGTKRSSMTNQELEGLADALGLGCSLFLTGQDIVEKNDTARLFSDLLGISFAGNATSVVVFGTSGEILNNLTLFTQGTSANNQSSRDSLRINREGTRAIASYGRDDIAGVRADDLKGGGRAVVLGFGFEAIHGIANRKTVMQRVMNYLMPSVVGVEQEKHERLPREFLLEQNYPNPFNPVTTIRFHIRASGWVSLKVYDLLGREIAEVVNGSLAAGTYVKSWDASNVPSGVYVYRLRSGEISETRSMLLIR